jgi:hypothetical protein
MQRRLRSVIVSALARGKEFEPDTAPYCTGMSERDLQLFVNAGSSDANFDDGPIRFAESGRRYVPAF